MEMAYKKETKKSQLVSKKSNKSEQIKQFSGIFHLNAFLDVHKLLAAVSYLGIFCWMYVIRDKSKIGK